MGPNFFKIAHKVIRVYLGRFGVYYGKKVIFQLKTAIFWASAIIAQNTNFWVKNHFLIIMTPKPAYIYSNNFLRENFSKKKFGPMGPPWGTWGPYLGIPLVEYFPNVFF